MNLFLKKTYHWIGYLGKLFDTRFIPLQNKPSPILVGLNSWLSSLLKSDAALHISAT